MAAIGVVDVRVIVCEACGVADAVEEADPVPIAFMPETLNVYVVPLVNPVTVALVDVEVPSLNVEKLVPSVEY